MNTVGFAHSLKDEEAQDLFGNKFVEKMER